MKNLFEEKGMLQVVLGRGSISAYEAGRLSPGCFVTVSDRMCGEPAYLFFNSHLVGYGQIIVIEGTFAARVTKISWNLDALSFAGEADDRVEMLESRIQLAAVPFTLHELSGVGPYSVIGLGKEHTSERNAELLIAGVPVAVGTVCVHHQGWALRVDDVLRQGGAGTAVAVSGSLRSEGDRAIKVYDFVRPDMFSLQQIKTLSLIHERFAASLTALSPEIGPCHVRLVDQLTFGELVSGLPAVASCRSWQPAITICTTPWKATRQS